MAHKGKLLILKEEQYIDKPEKGYVNAYFEDGTNNLVVQKESGDKVFYSPDSTSSYNNPPSVSLSRNKSGSGIQNSVESFVATPSDADGINDIISVKLLKMADATTTTNYVVLATSNSAPFNLSFMPINAGNYFIRALVTDAKGATSISSLITVNVISSVNHDYENVNLVMGHTSIESDTAYSGLRLQYLSAMQASYSTNNKQGGINHSISTAVAGQRVITGNGVNGLRNGLDFQILSRLRSDCYNLIILGSPTNELSIRSVYGSDLAAVTIPQTPPTAQQAADITFTVWQETMQEIKDYCATNNLRYGIIAATIMKRDQDAVPQPIFENARIIFNQKCLTALSNGTANFNAIARTGEHYFANTPGPKQNKLTTHFLKDGVHPSPAGRDEILVPCYVQASEFLLFGLPDNGAITVPPVRNYANAYAAALTQTGRAVSSQEMQAITQLENSLKSAGLLDQYDPFNSKIIIAYPFMGETTASQSINFTDPRRNNLVLAGNETASSDGFNPNGSVSDTQLNPGDIFELTSSHLATFLKNDIASSTPEINTVTAGNFYFALFAKYTDGNTFFTNGNSLLATYQVSTSAGFNVGTRTAADKVAIYKNGVKLSSDNKSAGGWPGGNIGLSANNNFLWAGAGFGLSDADNTEYYNSVNTFKSAIGR